MSIGFPNPKDIAAPASGPDTTNTMNATSNSQTNLGLTHNQRLMAVFQQGPGFDVTFLVGPTKVEVKAHQFVLITHSSVFQAMFLDTKPQNGITIADADESGFRKFLQFIYTGNFPENKGDPFTLLKYAVTYKVPDLADWCCKTVGESITTESAIAIYERACKLNTNELRDRALEFILTNAHVILDSDQFLQFTNHNLFKVLSSDSLAAKNETQVFEAVLRWGKTQCKHSGIQATGNALRNVLTDLLPLIRFPVMNKSDFSFVVATSEILTDKELISILLYFNVEESKRSSMPPGVFNSVERKWFPTIPKKPSTTSKEYIINGLSPYDIQTQMNRRFHGFHGPGFYDQSIQVVHAVGIRQIMFHVNHPIWITSIGINGIAGGYGATQRSDLCVSVEVIDTRNRQVVTSMNNMGISSLDNGTLPLQFWEDVRIQPDVFYTIKITFREGSFYLAAWCYSPAGDNDKEKSIHIPELNKSITMKFAEVTPLVSPWYTGLTQGFIPTIGFKLD